LYTYIYYTLPDIIPLRPISVRYISVINLNTKGSNPNDLSATVLPAKVVNTYTGFLACKYIIHHV